MGSFAKKKAAFILENANIDIFLLVEFQGFEFDDGDNPKFGIGCKVLEIEDVPVLHEQPYQMKIAKWSRMQILTDEQKSQFVFSVLTDALLKVGLMSGRLMRLPSIDIRI